MKKNLLFEETIINNFNQISNNLLFWEDFWDVSDEEVSLLVVAISGFTDLFLELLLVLYGLLETDFLSFLEDGPFDDLLLLFLLKFKNYSTDILLL